MQWTDIPLDPPRKTLRQFSVLWLVFFGGLALWYGLVRDRIGLGMALGVLALAIGPVGLIRPEWLRPIYVGWMILAFPIGWIISQLIVALLFFGLFVPMGLVFRLIGRDALNLRRRPDLDTYWIPRPAPPDPRQYFKQF
jgi:hypothetical protein